MRIDLAWRVAFGLLVAPLAAVAEETGAPLRFDVHPSGVEGEEDLDARLARRERGFRFICTGCVRTPGSLNSEAPFYPIRTLAAPGLEQALAPSWPGEGAEVPP